MSETRQTVWALFAVGVAMGVVGAFMVTLMWPDRVSVGDALPALGAGLLSVAGWLMASVAVIAWGVRFGVESARR